MSCPSNFNWRHYVDMYPDLRYAGICTEKDARSHYIHFGCKENRLYVLPIPVHFDWKFYLDTYTDLRENGLSNENDAIQHYLNHGYKENRVYSKLIPSDFNWKYYVNNNPDLFQNGITRSYHAMEHYILCGHNENRIYNKQINRKAVLCAIALGENLYLNEWIQYHLKLGFSKIYIYDNSDENEARIFQSNEVEIVHFPGTCMQINAYNHFLQNIRKSREFEWGGFIDIDEFIVLKKHETIIELLMEHCKDGALALNWVLFGSNGETEYRNEPVLKRFIRRSKDVNFHIKSLFCLDDVESIAIPHYVNLWSGHQRDCHGNIFQGSWNMEHASDDIACVHHYFTKSWGEYILKAARGEANRRVQSKHNRAFFISHDQNDIIDTSAWDFSSS